MGKKIIKVLHVHFAAIVAGVLILITIIATYNLCCSISGNMGKPNRGLFSLFGNDAEVSAMSMGNEYVIKEYDNRIGVYYMGDTIPFRVEQVYVAYLPEKDRSELRCGIYITGDIAMEKRLEDYRS